MRSVTKHVFHVHDYGAVGDAKTLNTTALNQAITACHEEGGGTVWVPAGTYVTGTVFLKSHVTLHLDAGAVLLGSARIEDYPQLPYTSEFRNTALVTAIDAENVTITGRGAVDGNSDVFMLHGHADLRQDFDVTQTRQGIDYLRINDQPDDGPLSHKERPGILMLILKCRDVEVSGINIRNAPNWCLHVARTEGALLTGLEIKNSLLVPNADCIDVSRSKNVRISDCNLEGGDDGMAFSPCAEGYGPSSNENITVENVTIVSRSAGIRLGWDAHNFRNFLFHNIVIHNSNRGIGIYVREGETIENVVFSNVVIETRLHKGKWWGKAEPIHISVVPLPEHTGPAFSGKLGNIRNVTFSNITAIGEQGIVVAGHAESLVEDLTFENVRLTIKKGELQEPFGGNFDFRPAQDPKQNVFAHDIPGLYAGHVKNLHIRNFDLHWEDDLPSYMKDGLEIERFDGVTIDGFHGRQPQLAKVADRSETQAGAAISLKDGRRATIRHSVAKPGTGRFLNVERVEKQGLFVHNDVTEAEKMISPKNHSFTLSANLTV